MKAKLIKRLTVTTSVIMLLSILLAAAAFYYARVFPAVPGQTSQKQQARIVAAHDVSFLRASALDQITFRDESVSFMAAASRGIFAVQALMLISCGASLFWLRRLQDAPDA